MWAQDRTHVVVRGTICGSRFSPSSMWCPGSERRPSGLKQVPWPTEPSYPVSPTTHFQSFSFLSPGYAVVHSPRFSFADLHQRHSSAPDSTEKTTLHFSEGKNKLCPHNSDPLEEQAEADSTYDLSGLSSTCSPFSNHPEKGTQFTT